MKRTWGNWSPQHLKQHLRGLALDEDGLTTVEYALLLALLVMGCAACMRGLGTMTGDTVSDGAGSFSAQDAAGGQPPPSGAAAPPSS